MHSNSESGTAASHGVMFHHFHGPAHASGPAHAKGQGSISAAEFSSMLDWLSDRHRILGAPEYSERLLQGELRADDICLSFDDALLCQADIAAPILKERGLQAYFFVYSSPLLGNVDYLEIFRHFRNTRFDGVDDFYAKFNDIVAVRFSEVIARAERDYDSASYLKNFPFYTEGDKYFRYLRDEGLGKQKYEDAMMELMREFRFDPLAEMKNLWMTEDHIRGLARDGHVIGLHSFSHPTTLHKLNRNEQQDEYGKNLAHLTEIVGGTIHAMSHPCGNYGPETLEVLSGLGITVGFRSSMSVRSIESSLEVPREDHANVLREMSR